MRATFCVSALVLILVLCFPPPGKCSSKAARAEAGAPAARSSVAEGVPSSVTIPGPLRSFLRMAGISQEASPSAVLPLLAREVSLHGYDWHGKSPKPTEYLILLRGYLEHSRELLALAGPEGVIKIARCGEAQPLLRILGYKLREACGSGVSLEAAQPKKAFLTIDSGFPLADLEGTLRGGPPFNYSFTSSTVPVLFAPNDWTFNGPSQKVLRPATRPGAPRGVIDSLVRDPALARLYWALSRMDVGTRRYLEQTVGVEKLTPFAAGLDFYGGTIVIRSGRVVVPGGVSAEPAWQHLVGASPASPDRFVTNLLSKDEGWMAAYFDALSRIPPNQQTYFTETQRLRNFYRALRGRNPSPGPAAPVFRPDPGLLLLVTRLEIGPNGEPHIPGGPGAWRDVLGRDRKNDYKVVREWSRRSGSLKTPDQVVAAMFGLSRVTSEAGPLHLFLILSEIDRRRSPDERLSPDTVRLMGEKFSRFGDQYLIFSEFQALNDASVARYLDVAQSLDHIRDATVRSDAIGIFQADASLWEILARQGEIPLSRWNDSWQRVIRPFAHVRSSAQLFDAAERSVSALLRGALGTARSPEGELVELLAGPASTTPGSQRVRQEMADRIRAAMEAQGLISVDTLFALGGDLNSMARGRPAPGDGLALAGELREAKAPKPLFSSGERAEWSYGLFGSPHIVAETSFDLPKILRSHSTRRQLLAARSDLVPFLRDALVGLNYAYYQSPGAQVLYNDPMFVRTHDFSAEAIVGRDQSWKTPSILGRGWTASGGAHLAGSLADLPYVLAEVEQNFISPEHTQALIWEDLVPTLLMNSVVPRWWRVSSNELSAVALYEQMGDDLVGSAAANPELRQKVMDILAARLLPRQFDALDSALRDGRREDALDRLAPADIFYLASEFRRRFPQDDAEWGKAGGELNQLSQRDPDDTNGQRIETDFGVPHPALAQTYARELLNVKPIPTFMDYSSELLAESWQSNNLYWACLADKLGYQPVMLNVLIPELTRRMVSKIFATDLEDRPALLRALRQTGEEFQKASLTPGPKPASGF